MATKKKPPLEPGYDKARWDRLRSRGEYREVEFDGSRWPFLVNGFGLKRAQEATGKDVQALLYDIVLTQSRAMIKLAGMEKRLGSRLADVDEATLDALPGDAQEAVIEQVALAMQAVGFTNNMEAYAAYFYAGVVSFYPEMAYDDVLLRVTQDNMRDIEPVVAEQIAKIYASRAKARTNGTRAKAEEQEGN